MMVNELRARNGCTPGAMLLPRSELRCVSIRVAHREPIRLCYRPSTGERINGLSRKIGISGKTRNVVPHGVSQRAISRGYIITNRSRMCAISDCGIRP